MSLWKCALTKESQMHISIDSSDVTESIESVSLKVYERYTVEYFSYNIHRILYANQRIAQLA